MKIPTWLISTTVYVVGGLLMFIIMFGAPDIFSADDPCWYAEGISCEESL